MWLSRDRINVDNQLSPWLQLTLTTFNHLSKRHVTPEARNVCFAWISAGQRHCMSRLTGGFDVFGCGDFNVTKQEFVLYDDLFDKDKDLLPKDVLVIVCEVSALTPEVSYVDSLLFRPAEPVTVRSMERTLSKDLRRMLDTGQGSDVTLVANDGHEFAAHTIILSTRAVFFAKTFEHHMQEKQEKRVTIKDLDSAAVKGLLEFMYTDEVSNITQLAVKLLPKADEYDIPRMKSMCEKSMATELNSENAAEFLLLADMHHASQLRAAASHFIATHWKDVKTTDGWTRLINHKPQLVDEVIDLLAEVVSELMIE